MTQAMFSDVFFHTLLLRRMREKGLGVSLHLSYFNTLEVKINMIQGRFRLLVNMGHDVPRVDARRRGVKVCSTIKGIQKGITHGQEQIWKA